MLETHTSKYFIWKFLLINRGQQNSVTQEMSSFYPVTRTNKYYWLNIYKEMKQKDQIVGLLISTSWVCNYLSTCTNIYVGYIPLNHTLVLHRCD